MYSGCGTTWQSIMYRLLGLVRCHWARKMKMAVIFDCNNWSKHPFFVKENWSLKKYCWINIWKTFGHHLINQLQTPQSVLSAGSAVEVDAGDFINNWLKSMILTVFIIFPNVYFMVHAHIELPVILTIHCRMYKRSHVMINIKLMTGCLIPMRMAMNRNSTEMIGSMPSPEDWKSI